MTGGHHEGPGAAAAPAAHHRPGGGFRNPWPTFEPHGLLDLLRWVIVERLRHPRPPTPPAAAFPRATPAPRHPRAAPGELAVTWVGHSTFLLQVGALNVLTDPVWSARASPLPFAGPRRVVAPALSLEALPPIDLVLLSHNHYDHLDVRTVRRLARAHPSAHWLAPLGVGAQLRRCGAASVTERDWWEEWRGRGAAVRCAPAQHFSARTPWDRDRALWCGWTLEADGRRVFFAGDTGWFPGFAEIGRRHGPFDLALLPIGAYAPRWFMRSVHLDPDEAVRAFVALGGRGALVPTHWGTFRLTDEDMLEPPARARAAWANAGLPDDRLWLLAHGETRAAP